MHILPNPVFQFHLHTGLQKSRGHYSCNFLNYRCFLFVFSKMICIDFIRSEFYFEVVLVRYSSFFRKNLFRKAISKLLNALLLPQLFLCFGNSVRIQSIRHFGYALKVRRFEAVSVYFLISTSKKSKILFFSVFSLKFYERFSTRNVIKTFVFMPNSCPFFSDNGRLNFVTIAFHSFGFVEFKT